MKATMKSVRAFHTKHGFALDLNLVDFKKNNNVTELLKCVSTSLITWSKTLEDALRLGDVDDRVARTQLMVEELGETVEALANCDELELLDGLSDCVFVNVGTAVAFGLPLPEGVAEICRSNATKATRQQGDVRLRNKGSKYSPPDLKKLLEKKRCKA